MNWDDMDSFRDFVGREKNENEREIQEKSKVNGTSPNSDRVLRFARRRTDKKRYERNLLGVHPASITCPRSNTTRRAKRLQGLPTLDLVHIGVVAGGEKGRGRLHSNVEGN